MLCSCTKLTLKKAFCERTKKVLLEYFLFISFVFSFCRTHPFPELIDTQESVIIETASVTTDWTSQDSENSLWVDSTTTV